MMGASLSAKTTSIRADMDEILTQPKMWADRQTDGFSALCILMCITQLQWI